MAQPSPLATQLTTPVQLSTPCPSISALSVAGTAAEKEKEKGDKGDQKGFGQQLFAATGQGKGGPQESGEG